MKISSKSKGRIYLSFMSLKGIMEEGVVYVSEEVIVVGGVSLVHDVS